VTLSLREREPLRMRGENSNGPRRVTAPLMVLPLPKGEGWGEGEQDSHSLGRVRFGQSDRPSSEGSHGFERFIISNVRLSWTSLTTGGVTSILLHAPLAAKSYQLVVENINKHVRFLTRFGGITRPGSFKSQAPEKFQAPNLNMPPWMATTSIGPWF